MKFSVAALALAAGVSATYPASNVTYTTEVLTKYETYCPGPTIITYGTQTYTVSKATTLTITDCPCTVSKPVYTTSAVVCSTCTAKPTTSVVYPTTVPTVVYPSGNATVSTVKPTGGVVTSATSATPTTSKPTTIPTAGAAKVGAGLAGLVGLAAALL